MLDHINCKNNKAVNIIQSVFMIQDRNISRFTIWVVSNSSIPAIELNIYMLCHVIVLYLLPGWGFPGGSAGKESACNVGDLGWVPGLGRSPGERNGYPLQYSGLENSMNCIVHGVAKSWTQLSDFHFHQVSRVLFFQELLMSQIL